MAAKDAYFIPDLEWKGQSFIEGGSVSDGPFFRMRGFDTNISQIVYWNSLSIDVGANDYPGVGPVTGVVVVEVGV